MQNKNGNMPKFSFEQEAMLVQLLCGPMVREIGLDRASIAMGALNPVLDAISKAADDAKDFDAAMDLLVVLENFTKVMRDELSKETSVLTPK